MNLTGFAIRYGFLLLLLGLVLLFSIVAEGFAGPRSAVFIFQSVSCPYQFSFSFEFSGEEKLCLADRKHEMSQHACKIWERFSTP